MKQLKRFIKFDLSNNLECNERSKIYQLLKRNWEEQYSYLDYDWIDVCKRDILYRRFCCATDSFLEPIKIIHKGLTIIEGSYSLYPSLASYYDYKIFLTVKEKEQLERIERRSGKDKLQAYINKWIPLEEEYFSTLKIEEACDLIVDTTSEK